MDSQAIYKSLSFLSLDGVTTSDELLKQKFFRKYGLDSLNAHYSELVKLGFVTGGMKNGVISLQLTPSGKNFVRDFKYISHLTGREKWIERGIGFVSGILATLLTTYLVTMFWG